MVAIIAALLLHGGSLGTLGWMVAAVSLWTTGVAFNFSANQIHADRGPSPLIMVLSGLSGLGGVVLLVLALVGMGA